MSEQGHGLIQCHPKLLMSAKFTRLIIGCHGILRTKDKSEIRERYEYPSRLCSGVHSCLTMMWYGQLLLWSSVPLACLEPSLLISNLESEGLGICHNYLLNFILLIYRDNMVFPTNMKINEKVHCVPLYEYEASVSLHFFPPSLSLSLCMWERCLATE